MLNIVRATFVDSLETSVANNSLADGVKMNSLMRPHDFAGIDVD